MLLALLSLALLNASQSTLTLNSLKGLSPKAMGNTVLAGRDHGVVETVAGPEQVAMGAEGWMEIVLTERASRRPGGCVRQRWTANFLHRRGDPEGSAAFEEAGAVTEVALPSANCSKGEFVHVNPGLSADEALRALRYLSDLRIGKAQVRISCSDTTGSTFCSTPEAIPQELARLRVWAVTKRAGATELWLGEPGRGFLTAVSYSETRPDLVSVRREIPAPF